MKIEKSRLFVFEGMILVDVGLQFKVRYKNIYNKENKKEI